MGVAVVVVVAVVPPAARWSKVSWSELMRSDSSLPSPLRRADDPETKAPEGTNSGAETQKGAPLPPPPPLGEKRLLAGLVGKVKPDWWL